MSAPEPKMPRIGKRAEPTVVDEYGVTEVAYLGDGKRAEMTEAGRVRVYTQRDGLFDEVYLRPDELRQLIAFAVSNGDDEMRAMVQAECKRQARTVAT